jgi:hypothetical protein
MYDRMLIAIDTALDGPDNSMHRSAVADHVIKQQRPCSILLARPPD